MKDLSKFLPVKTLDQIYKVFVRPRLDYCDIIYHKQPQVSQSPIGTRVFYIRNWSIRNWGYKDQNFKKLEGYITPTLRNWSVANSRN